MIPLRLDMSAPGPSGCCPVARRSAGSCHHGPPPGTLSRTATATAPLGHATAPRRGRSASSASVRWRGGWGGDGMAATDPFLSAYLAGTPVEVPERRGRAARGPAMASASETVALHGCVLSPEGPREDTWLVIQGGRIDRLAARKPAGVTSVRTDGVILPGLIDLHGHPEFNVFAPWEPPRSYPNRYSWRG